MRGNFVAKHMNEFNRGGRHTGSKRDFIDDWSDEDIQEFNNGCQKIEEEEESQPH